MPNPELGGPWQKSEPLFETEPFPLLKFPLEPLERYFEKPNHVMTNHAIEIVRALKATKITSRLNLRIRLS
jgi:hypothetical protein